MRAWLLVTLLFVGSVQALSGPSTECGPLAPIYVNGSFAGCTHGGDPVPVVSDLLPDLARDPVCVSPAAPDLDPYVLVMYARAFDDADNYASKAATIRSLVRSANGVLFDAANATGTRADLKVHCSAGDITVLNVVLPTAKASASFTTITNDLEAAGYGDSAIKYWVYYDDTGACSCGGTANLYLDDRPGPANLNMGVVPLGGQYAVDFGYDSVRILLHELMHTMGAVQNSAPHTTGAAHCTDGDIMCYNDGGPTATPQTTPCGSGATESRVDCGYDDYFHTNPAPGSYLSTHWNMGSRANRFLAFEDVPAGALR